jgi:hypothetical protein
VFLLLNTLKVDIAGPHFKLIACLNAVYIFQFGHFGQVLTVLSEHAFMPVVDIVRVDAATGAQATDDG